MITASHALEQTVWPTSNNSLTWQQQLAGAHRSLDSLFSALGLREIDAPYPLDNSPAFELRVPHSFVQRMETANWFDPLLLQVIPKAIEQETVLGFSADPLGEAAANPLPGLIHKYHGRVLLITSPACAINCRYCFRREFPYEDNRGKQNDWQDSLAYIRADTSINEVILSGGDPLASSDRYLAQLLKGIKQIDHIKRVRIHSRLPVVLPARINNELIAVLQASEKQLVMVIHSNHPNEINHEVADAMRCLQAAGITTLNQSVLLKDINNKAETLADLSESLFDIGVLPYYLHTLDKVSGSHHFDLTLDNALALHQQLQARLPGFLVPKLVTEIAGQAHKTLLFPQ
jgi:EF-P beta-lysylation protein EpmB